jgi:hypothetical protein
MGSELVFQEMVLTQRDVEDLVARQVLIRGGGPSKFFSTGLHR